jgi:hypothetical protein
MVFLVTLHGFIRWLILLAAFIGLGDAFYALYGGKAQGGTLGRTLPPIYLGLLDLQLLLGLVLLFAVPEALGRYLVHGIIMVVAVALAHVFRVRLKKAPEGGTARAMVLLYLVPLIVILVGLAARPRGV